MSEHNHANLWRVFDLVLAAPIDQREAILDRECGGGGVGGDGELKKRLQAMIAAAEDPQFLGSPTLARTAAMAALQRTEQHAGSFASDLTGTRLGPYKLLQRIGEGGFGTVYLAEQDSPVRRKVALKVIAPGMDSKQVIGRFEAERQALALMDHPHIARVFGGGLTPEGPTGGGGVVGVGGRPFFVMEYVVGDMITAFVDAHKLSLPERLELFQQVCHAVQHAHTKGIIHRDLKPANILVSMVDGKPFAKVIDFGIAKATGAAGGRLSDKSFFTEHRQLMGTPEYMSPEQAEGSPDIDTKTDVYALGVLLYELLTGVTPFDSKRLRSAAIAEIQRIIRQEEPPMPSLRLSRSLDTLASTAALRRVEPGRLSGLIKGELDWIVMKALEKERGRRYETSTALAADVGHHLAGAPVLAAPPSTAYRLRKFMKRNKGPVVTVSAVMLALAAGGSVAAWGLWRAEHANSKLRGQQAKAEEGVGKMMSIMTDGAISGRISSVDQESGVAEAAADPLAYAIAFGSQIAATLKSERSELATAAYTANLALAQAAMDAGNYPEARARLANCPEGKRGWEWAFLSQDANSITFFVRGSVRDISWTSDGAHVVAQYWGNDRPVLFDATTGEQIGLLDVRPAHTLQGVVGPDGQLLTSADQTRGNHKTEDGRRMAHVVGGRPIEIYKWTTEWALESTIELPLYTQLLQYDSTGERLLIGADEGDLPNTIGVAVVPIANMGGPSVVINGEILLHVASLCESAKCASGLSLLTPDGTRRIVAGGGANGGDRTVRFYEVKAVAGTSALDTSALRADTTSATPERELAVFTLDQPITNLQMTGDGTRLVIELADGSARVWDIRPAAERRADLQRDWAERVPAGEYLDGLWNAAEPATAGQPGATATLKIPTESLRDAIVNDAALTPLRRLVAVQLLAERRENLDRDADEAFTQLIEGQTDKAAVQAAAQAADLPMRVKVKVVELAAGWEYKPPRVSDAEKLAAEEAKRALRDAQLRVAASDVRLNDMLTSNNTSLHAQWLVEAGRPYEALLYCDMYAGSPGFSVRHAIRIDEGPIDKQMREGGPSGYAFDVITEVTARSMAYWLTGDVPRAKSERLRLDNLDAERAKIEREQPELVKFWDQELDFAKSRCDAVLVHGHLLSESKARVAAGASLETERERLLANQTVPVWVRSMFSNAIEESRETANEREADRLHPRLVELHWRLEEIEKQRTKPGYWLLSGFDSLATRLPQSAAAQRLHARALLRAESFNQAIEAAAKSDAIRLGKGETLHPSSMSIQAMAHWKLANGAPLQEWEADEPLTDAERERHRAAALEARGKVRAIMADLTALSPNGKPWSEDADAKALLAEAEALIGGHTSLTPKPAETPK